MKKNLKEIIKSKKIGLIIYSRMSSKRLPGKVLIKIHKNQNVIDIIINNLKKIKLITNVVIATSKKKNDRKIINFCKINGISYFSGSHENVFLRTVNCINKYNFRYIVRICADRPFFDVNLMKRMINLMLKKKLDIVTNANPRTYPKGLTCEIAKAKIFKINQKKLNKTDKEHIFNYFYRSQNYKIYNLKSKFDKKFIDKDFCLDSYKDIKKIRDIFLKFSKIKKKITANNLFKFS